MIQELLLSDHRKISNPFSSPLLTTDTSIATTPPCTTTTVHLSSTASGGAGAGAGNGNGNSESNGNNNQNLRCPRCDSTNTKFCYYNNYNLTQPRHFCKTCRRYWTKGGTLRNVPIGGGCRKNKSSISSNNSPISSSSLSSKSSTSSSFLAKIKANTLTSEMLVNDHHHNSLFLGNGFSDHSSGPGPLPWSSSLPQAQNSHILALLRGSSPFSNPNNPNPSSPNPTSSVFTSLGLDSYGNGAPSLLGSFTRNNNNQHHLLNGFAPNLMMDNNHESNNNNGNSNSNIMDLYQRLKSSTSNNNNNYGFSQSNNENNNGSIILGHMVGTPSSSSSSRNTSIYETVTTPFGGGGDHLGGYGFMNSNHGISSWNDFPAVPINGTYP